MACGGRVWKGDTITISVPFDVSGYTDLTISYYTDGEMKVVKSESDVEIEDGFITYTFLPGELDTIADGVIRYQIDYSVDNVDYVTGTNTMSYLKTPKTYSAKTTEEYYEEGFSSGYTQGEEVGYASGHTDGYTEGHEIGYEEGHAQGKYEGYESGHYDGMIEGFESGYTAGQADCPECSGGTSCNLQSGNLSLPPEGVGIWTLYPEEGYDGFSYFQVVDNGYAESYWEQGYGSGFESGYTAGQADCSGGTSCDLTETWIDLMEGDDFEGQGVDYYVSAITPNYDGWYKVHVQDKDYGYSKFNEGYREFQNGLTSFSFGPEQVVASGNGSFTYTNASGWSSVTIGMPLVYSCRVIFANISNLHNILSASDVTDIWFGYETLTQSEVIVGYNDITIYGTPTYDTGRFEGIRFAIPTSIFSQISSWDASALSLNGFKSNLNQYIGGIALYPYRTNTWQSGDKTFISVSTFNFSE